MIRRDLGMPITLLSVAAVRTGVAMRTGTLAPGPVPARASGDYSLMTTLAVFHGLLMGWLIAEQTSDPHVYDWEVDGL